METGMTTGRAADAALNGGAKAKRSIWLVDDAVAIRQTCVNLLEWHGEFKCNRQFSSAEEAIAALRQAPGPELLLLDVSMPGMNGATAVKTIKSLSPGTKVFMFSTSFDAQRAEEARAGGASGYLRKSDPFARNLQTMLMAVASGASTPTVAPAETRAGCSQT